MFPSFTNHPSRSKEAICGRKGSKVTVSYGVTNLCQNTSKDRRKKILRIDHYMVLTFDIEVQVRERETKVVTGDCARQQTVVRKKQTMQESSTSRPVAEIFLNIPH
jgi:hypothetical protein